MADNGGVVGNVSNGVLLVVVGLVIFYIGISGKFDCFAGLVQCLFQSPKVGAGK